MHNTVFKSKCGFWYFWTEDEQLSLVYLTEDDAVHDFEQYCIWLDTGETNEGLRYFDYTSNSQYPKLSPDQITSMHNAIINYHEMQNELLGVDSWLLDFAGSDSLCQKFKNFW